MNIRKILVTGSSGLIWSEVVTHFATDGVTIYGIDNNMRQEFFGAEASTEWQRKQLEVSIPNYKHYSSDIRDEESIFKIFNEYSKDIKLLIRLYFFALILHLFLYSYAKRLKQLHLL